MADSIDVQTRIDRHTYRHLGSNRQIVRPVPVPRKGGGRCSKCGEKGHYAPTCKKR